MRRRVLLRCPFSSRTSHYTSPPPRSSLLLLQVTNTGTVDSDDVVLGFLVPPGAGTNGVPLQVRGVYNYRKV